MANTIYATFADPSNAEKAAGALLDHGVRAEDISVVRSHDEKIDELTYSHSVSDEQERANASNRAATTGSTGNLYGENAPNTRAETPYQATAEENRWEAQGDRGSYATGDQDNDMKNAGDAAWGATNAAGNKLSEWGDRGVAAGADALGAEGTEAKYRAAAEENRMEAIEDGQDARREWADATDKDKDHSRAQTTGTTTGYGTTSGDVEARREHHDEDENIEDAAKHGISTTTGADAGAGAVKGTAWGIGIGAVAALASLIVPGVGIVLGGGALAAALGGVAASAGAGAAAGAVVGYLKDQGMEAHVAEEYDKVLAGGGAMLAVSTPSGDCDENRVREVLEKYGALNIRSYSTRTSGGYVA